MKKINCVRRCRLCAREEELNNFCNIFDDNPALDIEMKITKLLPVVVMPWDPMPHKVCHSCIEKLNLFDEFYENSLRAEKFLRTLHPCAPDTLSTSDPLVQVLDSPILTKHQFRLPPLKHSSSAHPPASPPRKEPSPPRSDPKKLLTCFIINELTSRDSIFTCRECFRTFTKESSALTHSCVRLEDCQELRAMEGAGEGRQQEEKEKDQEKALPPLKIRLFSMKSGLFVCYLCQAPFEDKTELVVHIKSHFVDGKWDEERNRKKGSEGGREGECLEEVVKVGTKRKRRKCLGPRKKGGKRKAMASEENGVEDHSLKDSEERTKEKLNALDNEREKSEAEDDETQKMRSEDLEMKGESKEKANAKLQEEEKAEKEDVDDKAEKSLEEVVLEEEALEDRSEEITIVEMIKNKTPTSFSSCVFCDKIFATKGGLIAHQRKHLQGCLGVKFEEDEVKGPPKPHPTAPPDSETFYCSICAMMFTNRKTLLEHQQFHLVDVDAIG